jgi:hypothetical protein
MAFADDALAHMQKHGMDTVFCMTGGPNAVELLSYHTRYTKKQVEDLVFFPGDVRTLLLPEHFKQSKGQSSESSNQPS